MIRFSALRVTYYLRSGREITFLADNIKTTTTANDLTTLTVTDRKGDPHYTRLEAIDAITLRKVFWLRWRS